MSKFIIQPHGRLQEWIAHEKGYFTDEGLDYEIPERDVSQRVKKVDENTGEVAEIKSGAYEAYIRGKQLDKTTMEVIDSDLNEMVNKWNGYPTYNHRLPTPLMRLQTVLIYWFQKHYQQRNIIGNILRSSFRNPNIEKLLGLFSMKYWNSN